MGFRKTQKNVVKVSTKALGDYDTYHLLPEATDFEIKGIFDNAFIEIQGVCSTYPVYNVDLETIPRAPSVKDKLTIEGVLYKVLEIRSDGIGGSLLVLQKT